MTRNHPGRFAKSPKARGPFHHRRTALHTIVPALPAECPPPANAPRAQGGVAGDWRVAGRGNATPRAAARNQKTRPVPATNCPTRNADNCPRWPARASVPMAINRRHPATAPARSAVSFAAQTSGPGFPRYIASARHCVYSRARGKYLPTGPAPSRSGAREPENGPLWLEIGPVPPPTAARAVFPVIVHAVAPSIARAAPPATIPRPPIAATNSVRRLAHPVCREWQPQAESCGRFRSFGFASKVRSVCLPRSRAG